MTPAAFQSALALADIRPDSRTAAALRLMVDGTHMREAARQAHVDVGAVSRAWRRLEPHLRVKQCPTCGHRL